MANRWLTNVGRAWRLRCPGCGQTKLFSGWFRMHTGCEHCGLHYERAPGFFLGSIYVNYGLTAVLMTAGYFALFFTDALSPTMTLVVLGLFCVLFPLFFFRYARSLWLAMDHTFDPARDEERTPTVEK